MSSEVAWSGNRCWRMKSPKNRTLGRLGEDSAVMLDFDPNFA